MRNSIGDDLNLVKLDTELKELNREFIQEGVK
jgi:hypothetical protein